MPDPFSCALGALLRDATQAAVAARVGVSPQLVSDWKRGRRRPAPGQVFALERALGAAPGELSRHLGFVPIDADAVAVTDALGDLATRVRDRVADLVGHDAAPEVTALLLADGRTGADTEALVARAAEHGLAMELLRVAVEDFEREHGALTKGELRRARERLARASGSSPVVPAEPAA